MRYNNVNNLRMTDISKFGEFGLIKHLTEGHEPKNRSTIYGVGDDCAVLHYSDKEVLVTTDMLMEGIHFALGGLCQMLLAIVGNIRIREFYMIEIFWKLCLIDGKLLGEGSRVIAYSAHGECGSTGIDIVSIFSIVIYAISQLAICLVRELPSRRDRLRMIEEDGGWLQGYFYL